MAQPPFRDAQYPGACLHDIHFYCLALVESCGGQEFMGGGASPVNEDIAAVAGSCNEKVCAEISKRQQIHSLTL
jgi:hypothetical protein